MCQGCFLGVIEESLHQVSRMFKMCVKIILGLFEKSFKSVSKVLFGCFKPNDFKASSKRVST